MTWRIVFSAGVSVAILAAAMYMLFFESGFFVSVDADMWLSPDERVYSYVAEQFIQNGFSIRQSISQESWFLEMVRSHSPIRTAFVSGGTLVPVGFAAWPVLLGVLLLLVHPQYAVFALGIPLVWGIWKVSDAERDIRVRIVFMLSHLALLLSFGAVVYYLSRPLFPNIWVVFLVIAGGLFWVSGYGTKRNAYGVFAIALWTLALCIRPVELIWIAPYILACIWRFRIFFTVRSYVISVSIAVACSAMALLIQINTTSSILPGYIPVSAVEASVEASFTHYILPFGFHPIHMAHNFLLLVKTAGAGLFVITCIALLNENKKKKIWIVGLLGSVSGMIFLYYGNWIVFDNPQSILGATSSFTRYALPIVGVAWFVHLVSDIEKYRVARTALLAGILFLISWVQLHTDSVIWWNIPEQRTILYNNIEKKKSVLEKTNVDSIVFTRIADKWIWPERFVFQPPETWENFSVDIPVSAYWYAFCRETDFTETYRSPDQKECLYRIK